VLVDCRPVDDAKDVGTFKIGSNGRIEVFGSKVDEDEFNIVEIAKTRIKNSLFSSFTAFGDADGGPSMSIYPNGYTSVRIATTANAEEVGINLKTGKGFYKDEDHGSGNGNTQKVLSCKARSSRR